jgi:hypothetical protein
VRVRLLLALIELLAHLFQGFWAVEELTGTLKAHKALKAHTSTPRRATCRHRRWLQTCGCRGA